jgi:hypothetical protein
LGPAEQQALFGVVAGIPGGQPELICGSRPLAKTFQQIAAHCVQWYVAVEFLGVDGVVEGGQHPSRIVELGGHLGFVDTRGRRSGGREQRRVVRGDLAPVGGRESWRGRVAGGDRGLQPERPWPGILGQGQRVGTRQCGKAPADAAAIPTTAILILKQHWVTSRVNTRGEPRAVQFDQRQQRLGLGVIGGGLRQHACHAQGHMAEVGPRPIGALACNMALGEDQVDYLAHRAKAFAAFGRGRYFEADVGLGELALATDDALRDGRLGNQKGACQRGVVEPADGAQRECAASVGG